MANLIVAYDKNKVIGIGNELPWKQKTDLLHVKNLTTNKSILMGYNTHLSLPKALPNRKNLVLANDNLLEGFIPFTGPIETIKNNKDIFVFGGAKTYEQALPYVDFLYITEIDTKIKGDNLVYFPDLDLSEWDLIDFSDTYPADENNDYPYKFLVYSRKYDLFEDF